MSTPPQKTPLYRKIADELANRIASGEFIADRSLPSEFELAEQYQVSRGTIRQTFSHLRATGVVTSRQGARREAVPGQRLQSFSALVSFSHWAKAAGATPSGRVIELERRRASRVEQELLELPDSAWVYHLIRLRLLDGKAVMVESTSYLERVGALLAGIDLAKDSITDRLAQLGFVLAEAEHTIDAIAADDLHAELLEVAPDAPLLRERRVTSDPNGTLLEYSEDVYRADSIAFTMRNSSRNHHLLKNALPPA